MKHLVIAAVISASTAALAVPTTSWARRGPIRALMARVQNHHKFKKWMQANGDRRLQGGPRWKVEPWGKVRRSDGSERGITLKQAYDGYTKKPLAALRDTVTRNKLLNMAEGGPTVTLGQYNHATSAAELQRNLAARDTRDVGRLATLTDWYSLEPSARGVAPDASMVAYYNNRAIALRNRWEKEQQSLERRRDDLTLNKAKVARELEGLRSPSRAQRRRLEQRNKKIATQLDSCESSIRWRVDAMKGATQLLREPALDPLHK